VQGLDAEGCFFPYARCQHIALVQRVASRELRSRGNKGKVEREKLRSGVARLATGASIAYMSERPSPPPRRGTPQGRSVRHRSFPRSGRVPARDPGSGARPRVRHHSPHFSTTRSSHSHTSMKSTAHFTRRSRFDARVLLILGASDDGSATAPPPASPPPLPPKEKEKNTRTSTHKSTWR
jgi:hypothetical protein